MEAQSFASRRPAANSLPPFSLPLPDIPSTRYPTSGSVPTPPTSNLPSQDSQFTPQPLYPTPAASQPQSLRPLFTVTSSILTQPPPGVATDGLSPLSGTHSGSSQSSQPTSTHGMYYHHVTGSWPTPASQTSSYNFASNGGNHSGNPSLVQQPYPSSRSMYPAAPPSAPQQFAGPGRSTAPTIADGLQTSSYQESSALFTSISNGGASQSNIPQRGPPQQGPASQGASSSVPPRREPGHGPPQSSGPYYPPSTAAQQQPFPAYGVSAGSQPPLGVTSPPTSSAMTPTSNPGPLSAAPPMGYGHADRPHGHPYSGYHMPANPVLSNMHHPGTPLAMVNGVGGMGIAHGYSPHGHQHPMGTYGHGQPVPSDVRPYRCDQCNQSFNRNHDLKRHKRIHLAVKPFPCTFCEKSFSRKDALKRHRLVKGCGGKQSPRDGANSRAGANGGGSPQRSEAMSDEVGGSPRLLNRGDNTS